MLLSKLEPQLRAALAVDDTTDRAPWSTQLLWFFDGLLLFFFIPWLATDALSLDNDFYYAIFIWCALTFLYRYVRITKSGVLSWLSTRWRSSTFLGLLSSIYLVVNVWTTNPTEHPTGWLLAFELAWRGVAYGIVLALVLTAFPVAIGIGVFKGDISGPIRRGAFAFVTLALVWTMSTAYHLGFKQFEGNVATPQLASTAVSVPAAVSVNPLGSILAQTVLHVAATYRTFESDLFVPPAVEFHPDYEPPGIFGPGSRADGSGCRGEVGDYCSE